MRERIHVWKINYAEDELETCCCFKQSHSDLYRSIQPRAGSNQYPARGQEAGDRKNQNSAGRGTYLPTSESAGRPGTVRRGC